MRKIKEEPLVPLGLGLTVYAFVAAYRAIRRGDSQQANRMFRARIAAQGFTVLAMVAGSMYYQKDREKTKELQKLQGEKMVEEKQQKWIKELEARHEEDTKFKAHMQDFSAQKRKHQEGSDEPKAMLDGQVEGGRQFKEKWAAIDKQRAEESEKALQLEKQGRDGGGMPEKTGLMAKGEEAASQAAEKSGEALQGARDVLRQRTGGENTKSSLQDIAKAFNQDKVERNSKTPPSS